MPAVRRVRITHDLRGIMGIYKGTRDCPGGPRFSLAGTPGGWYHVIVCCVRLREGTARPDGRAGLVTALPQRPPEPGIESLVLEAQ